MGKLVTTQSKSAFELALQEASEGTEAILYTIHYFSGNLKLLLLSPQTSPKHIILNILFTYLFSFETSSQYVVQNPM